MPAIQKRGPHQFRVQFRRNGVSVSETFETYKAAEDWLKTTDGKLTGGQPLEHKAVRSTTLLEALEWGLEGKHHGAGANGKNLASKWRYWKTQDIAKWAIGSIHDWDLIEWRRTSLDEDNAEDGETTGPEADGGAQTCIHRLNALSMLFQTWSRAHKVPLENPVKPGVRPKKPDGRDRRLLEGEEKALFDTAKTSSRPWLPQAITISLETCVRQGELAGLIWRRVKLDAEYPHIDLPKTKNDRPRRVPLSKKAIKAFMQLRPKQNTEIGELKVLGVETPRGVIHAFRDVVTEEKFPDLRWHDLRHEAISRLFELTDLRDHEIMAITGHLTPSMLARYTHLRADRLGARLPGGSRKRAA